MEATEAEGGHPFLLCNFEFYFVISYSILKFSKNIPIQILFSIFRYNI